MTIKLSSARIDENGRAVNGKAGDQTGKELATENAYIWSGGWDCCIRIKNITKREKYIKFIKWACASPLIGYDQNQRLTLYNALKALDFDYKKLTKKVECDCSSLVACGLIVCGFTKISPKATTHYNKDIDTSLSLVKTMKKNYPNSFSFFDSSYKHGNHTKVSTWWRNGDILIKYGHHVVTVTSGGRTEASYYSKYKGESTKIDDVFKAISVPSKYIGSVTARKPIAKANGITSYGGTLEQNLSLISMAKSGTLKKP